ncbi:MAG: putative Na+/H+ antiporter [Bdellovibrio sp.]|nr:putative Na+/H+ antiporter [Bdellovibrio sp.]
MRSIEILQWVATICLVCAVMHTFLVKQLQHIANKFSQGSIAENFFHLLGEVEVVFGLWACVFLVCFSFIEGNSAAISYLESRNFTEPVFVFIVMVVCATKPVLYLITRVIEKISIIIPFNRSITFYGVTLILGPLLGSFITEPAAMTVTALILLDRYYQQISVKLKYATLGLLFVNVSIGGTLTPYAAPPIIMVANQWSWDLGFMLKNFAWKSALSIVIATGFVALRFRKELMLLPHKKLFDVNNKSRIPFWVSLVHVFFMLGIVVFSRHMSVFGLLFMLFLGFATVAQEYQHDLKIREGLLVAFFLSGLVILGGMQRWWLESLLSQLTSVFLYLSAVGLTAVMDNAALTYLGSQVSGLSEATKYLLVAGSVVGGGLTVIANAPNPAGHGILNSSFGSEGISPWGLFKGALVPTLIAVIIFGIFR